MKTSAHNRYYQIAALMLLVFLFCHRIFMDLGKYGMGDWDQHLFFYGSFIKSIFDYQQAPFWNPWFCGGNVLWQHPQTPLISPAYLFSMIMPLLVAMKLNILLHYGIAIFGAYLVARRFGIQRFSLILLGAAFFVFNSFFAMQITEGHTWIFPFAYVPFAYYFFDRALCSDNRLDIVLTAVVLTLMLLGAGVYPLVYTMILLVIQGAVTAWLDRQWKPLFKLAIAFIFFAGFSSIKILPVLDFASQYPRVSPHNEFVLWSGLNDVFFGREQVVGARNVIPGQIWGWHEYGCYIGVGLGLLLLTSWVFCFMYRSRVALIAAIGLAVFFLISLGRFHELAPYAWFSHLPILESLRVPGRAFILASFCASLVFFVFAKWVESRLEHSKSRDYGIVFTVAAIFLLGDLFLVNTPIFGQAFRFSPQKVYDRIPLSTEPIRTVLKLPSYGPYSSMYVGLTRNVATLNCYDEQKPAIGFNPNKDLVFATGDSKISKLRFTPNHVSFDLVANETVLVSLNQNYVRGWRFNAGSVKNTSRRPAVQLSAGKYSDLRFYFIPPYFLSGAMIGLISILLAVLFVRPKLASQVYGKIKVRGRLGR